MKNNTSISNNGIYCPSQTLEFEIKPFYKDFNSSFSSIISALEKSNIKINENVVRKVKVGLNNIIKTRKLTPQSILTFKYQPIDSTPVIIVLKNLY